MPRFALLRHDCPSGYREGPHWDLMLEREGVSGERRLATWSLLELPRAWADPMGISLSDIENEHIVATELADHRAAYLEYEGEVSGGRGSVKRLAEGEVAWLRNSQGDIEVDLIASRVLAACDPRIDSRPTIDGKVRLTRTESDQPQWLLALV